MSVRPSISRRSFLRNLTLGATAAIAAACAPAATEAPKPASQATKAPETGKATDAPKSGLPITKDPITLTYWVAMNQNVGATLKSFSEMTCYKELEKITGIKIEFQHPPIGQENEQFNLMIASGKFPDIIEHGWQSAPGGPAKYLKDGVILKLNDLVDKQAPNYKKVLTDNPAWRRQILTDEGEIYCFAFLRSDPYLLVFQGPIIRQDWLDKVGMKMPSTINEWQTVLTAFKEKDPNGNGKADDIPFSPFLYGRPFDGWRISHAFVGAWGITFEFFQENGKVKYGMIEPAFKEYLGVMAQWYKEGLIDKDFPTTDQKLMDAKVTGDQLGAFVQNTGGGIGKYMGLMKDKDPKFKLVAAPYPVLKAGDKPKFGQRDFNYPGTGAAITTSNKKVSETVRWLDYAYSKDGYMLFNFGVPGLTYNMVNGYPKYTDLIMNNPNKLPLQQSMGQHFRSNFSGPFVQAKEYMEQYANLPEQQDSLKIWTQPTNEGLMPPVTPTQEESKKFATIMTEINTLRDEAFIKIITGAQPVTYWDQVVTQMKQMGIEDAIKIQQAALDRYNKRP